MVSSAVLMVRPHPAIPQNELFQHFAQATGGTEADVRRIIQQYMRTVFNEKAHNRFVNMSFGVNVSKDYMTLAVRRYKECHVGRAG